MYHNAADFFPAREGAHLTENGLCSRLTLLVRGLLIGGNWRLLLGIGQIGGLVWDPRGSFSGSDRIGIGALRWGVPGWGVVGGQWTWAQGIAHSLLFGGGGPVGGNNGPLVRDGAPLVRTTDVHSLRRVVGSRTRILRCWGSGIVGPDRGRTGVRCGWHPCLSSFTRVWHNYHWWYHRLPLRESQESVSAYCNAGLSLWFEMGVGNLMSKRICAFCDLVVGPGFASVGLEADVVEDFP